MPATAEKPRHTCQYNQTCAACLAEPNRPRPGIDVRDVKLAQQVSRYRDKTNVECNTLPLHTPGADSYSPLGKPRFTSLRKLKYVGEKFGLRWA